MVDRLMFIRDQNNSNCRKKNLIMQFDLVGKKKKNSMLCDQLMYPCDVHICPLEFFSLIIQKLQWGRGGF